MSKVKKQKEQTSEVQGQGVAKPKGYVFDASKVNSLADVKIFIQLCGLNISEAGYNNAPEIVKHYFIDGNN